MTAPETAPSKQPFQAEVQQLLDIVIHSLYTDREIFVRELVSNASDALERLRHLQLTENDVFDPSLPLEINVSTDETAKTITIVDHGDGMTRDELVENLGTIAHSGTKAFLQALKDSDAAKGNVIGQFGVGFYSAFMVAGEVTVYTHSWRQDGEHLAWTSDGRSGYEIEEAPGQRRGCKVVVKLTDEFAEFSKPDRVRQVLQSYSNFVPFPINLNGEKVNTVEALWLKSRKDITDEEYKGFYQFVAHAFDEPRMRLHFNADAPLALNALLFVPQENPERWGMGQTEPGVALYCRKVLIDQHPKGLLPEWLRFLRGVIDSEDLPLNISRESMQDSALVQKLNRVITKRFLKHLESVARDEPEKYLEFYQGFGRFLKEGAAVDFSHRDQIAKLLRFESSAAEAGELTGLEDYLARAKDGQDAIYYQVAPNRSAVESGPYLEAFRIRGIEVLFLYETIDDYVVGGLGEFDGNKLVAVDRADIDLADQPVEQPPQGEPLSSDETDRLTGWLKDVLGDSVTAVRASKRLVESPAAALTPADALSPQMRQMMRALKQDGADEPAKVELEINPSHPVVKGLATASQSKPDVAKLVAAQLLDNAMLSAGLLDDTHTMVNRLHQILGEVVGEGGEKTG